MPRNARAILFDLDDTLFAHRRFRLSGFAAVARVLEAQTGRAARSFFTQMVAASRKRETYGREFDVVLSACSLPVSKEQLIQEMREHRPNLRLTAGVRRTLRALRSDWRLAIVTNGIPAVQHRKVQALGLSDAVDAVIFATEHGTGLGKPDREPFVEALRRLDVDPDRTVFVGDDERNDIYGAARCGMRTIQTRQWRRTSLNPLAAVPDATVVDIVEVPAVATRLLTGKLLHHAA